jgi:hypothetical protein
LVAARWNSNMSRSSSMWPRSRPGEANAKCVIPCRAASLTSLGGAVADLLLGGGRQVPRFGKGLPHS